MGTKGNDVAACSKFVLVTLCLFQLLKSVAAKNYVVGANSVTGALWTNDPGPNNNNLTLVEQYEKWAKSVRISVGDTLQFSYGDSHTVVLVGTQQMYDSCTYETYVDVTSRTPPTIYTVSDTKPLYFVCSIDKHCAEGQKVAITNILAAGSPPPPTSSLPPAPSNQGHLFRPASRLRSCLPFSLLLLFALVIT